MKRNNISQKHDTFLTNLAIDTFDTNYDIKVSTEKYKGSIIKLCSKYESCKDKIRTKDPWYVIPKYLRKFAFEKPSVTLTDAQVYLRLSRKEKAKGNDKLSDRYYKKYLKLSTLHLNAVQQAQISTPVESIRRSVKRSVMPIKVTTEHVIDTHATNKHIQEIDKNLEKKSGLNAVEKSVLNAAKLFNESKTNTNDYMLITQHKNQDNTGSYIFSTEYAKGNKEAMMRNVEITFARNLNCKQFERIYTCRKETAPSVLWWTKDELLNKFKNLSNLAA